VDVEKNPWDQVNRSLDSVGKYAETLKGPEVAFGVAEVFVFEKDLVADFLIKHDSTLGDVSKDEIK